MEAVINAWKISVTVIEW